MPIDGPKTAALLLPVRGFKKLCREWFSTPAAGPLATPRTAEPGPGGFTLTQSGGNLAINSLGELALVAQGSPSWGGMGFYGTAAIPRKAGTVLLFDLKPNTGNTIVGFRTNQALDTSFRHALYVTSAPVFNAMTPTQITLDPAVVADARLQFAIVLRAAAGAFWFYKRASAASWTFLRYDETGNEANLYLALSNYDGTHTVDNLEVVEALWNPLPLASDTFNRANSANLGATDGAGTAEANGGGGLAWSQVSGTMQISSNRLMLSGAAGASPAYSLSVVDAGASDVYCRASVNVVAGENTTSVVLRYVDNNNFWAVNFATGALTIVEVTGGVATTRATGSAITAGVRDVEAIAEGLRIVARVDGANKLVYDQAAGATGQTATQHGFRLAGATAYCDNFVVFHRRHAIRTKTRGRNLSARAGLAIAAPYDTQDLTFVNVVNAGSVSGPREWWSDAHNYRIRQTGYLKRIKLYVYSGAISSLKLRIWRQRASGYYEWNHVATSDELVSLVTGGQVNTITLPTPLAVQEGDSYSVRIDCGNANRLSVRVNRTFPTQVYYTDSPPADGATLFTWRYQNIFGGQAFTATAGSANFTCTGHTLATGDPVALVTTGLLPRTTPQIFPGSTYYARSVDANTLRFYTSAANANSDTSPITANASQAGASGTHQVAEQQNALQVECDFDPPQVVCIGDSLTSGSITHSSFSTLGTIPNTAYSLADAYPYKLGQLTGLSYQNLGIAGQTSTQIQARFATDVVALKPASVVILCGTNDVSQGATLATYLANVKAMLESCRDNAIVPIVVTIPPSTAQNNTLGQTRDSFNAALKTLAAAYADCVLVECGAALGQYRAGGDPGNLWDLQAAYNSGDGTHLNAAGYQVLAQLIASAVS